MRSDKVLIQNTNPKVKIYRSWNIFSLVLIVLLLFSLILLTVSTPMTGIGHPWITLPELSNTRPLPEKGDLVEITIIQRGVEPEVFVMNKLVSDINKLSEIVEKEINEANKNKVLILCDGKIQWRYLRNVLDLLRKRKITDIALLSDKPAKGYDLIIHDFNKWMKKNEKNN